MISLRLKGVGRLRVDAKSGVNTGGIGFKHITPAEAKSFFPFFIVILSTNNKSNDIFLKQISGQTNLAAPPTPPSNQPTLF